MCLFFVSLFFFISASVMATNNIVSYSINSGESGLYLSAGHHSGGANGYIIVNNGAYTFSSSPGGYTDASADQFELVDMSIHKGVGAVTNLHQATSLAVTDHRSATATADTSNFTNLEIQGHGSAEVVDITTAGANAIKGWQFK